MAASAPVAAQLVTSSGDVSPAFAPAPTVSLPGQSLIVGSTTAGVGTLGSVGISGGGSLTAAQLALGNGGLGTGTLSVAGTGSTISLTGSGATNGLAIGNWGTGIATVSNGGSIVCSTTLACAFNTIGNAAGSTGTLAINGGTVSGLGQLYVGWGQLGPGFGTIGANTSATLNISNGGSLTSSGFNSVANNSSQTGTVTGNVTIAGVGSSWNITRDLANGGGQAFLALAPAANANANVTISNGGSLTVTGSRSTPATDNSIPGISMSSAAGATSTMTVTTGGSVRIGGDTGVFIVGGSSTVNSAGSTATVNITGGGSVAGTGSNGLTLMVIGRNSATGTVNVSGAGSQLVVAGVGGQNTQGIDGVGGLVQVGRNQGFGGGTGALNVTNGGSVLISDNGLAASTGSMGLRVAIGVGSTGSVTVSGPGSSIVIASTGGSATTPHVRIGEGGTGQMTISNGATVSVLGSGERDFTVGNAGAGAGSGTLNMAAGGVINASRFAVADNGGLGTATIDASTISLDGVINFNGFIGAGVRVGRGVGANGLLTLQNGAVINIDNSVASASVILGGTASLAAGTGTLNMSGGSAINFTGSASGANLQVGGVSGTGFMTMTGNSVVNVGSTGSLLVGTPAGSAGTLTIAGGSRIYANTGNIGGSSDTAAGGTGNVTITGAGSLLSLSGDTGFLGVGRGGTGSLSVSNQGTLEAIAVNVGRATGALGTMTVDAATINLSGQQTTGNFAGASLSVGVLGGTGTVNVTNGAQVNVTNLGSSGAGVSVGGTFNNPLGNGTLLVSGGSAINVVAAPGLAAFQVGRDGTGLASFAGNSSINIGDGNVYVGRLAGSTGTLTLASGSTLSAGNIYIGGASDTVPGGNGTVTVTGAGSALTLGGPTGVISVGQNGSGSLVLANQATASAIDLSVGRAAGGVGTVSIDNATLTLAGQQSGGNQFGAGIALGWLGGTGSASITNGSVVTVANAGLAGAGIYLGGTSSSSGGTGSLTISNSQVSVLGALPPAPVAGQIPAPGSATVVFGYDGTGVATLNNSTLQVGNPTLVQDGNLTLTAGDGALIIGSQAGSTGLLTANAGSVINAGYVGIGVGQPAVAQAGGGFVQSNGGFGQLTLNNSTLNTTTLEIGAQGILSGNGGVVRAAGGVIVGGTISPGNSPGRLVIDCNLTFLSGSRLIFDVLANASGGYDVDQLILGPNAVFNFANLVVDFNFLGDTDPNAFLASGLFTLDTFFQRGDLVSFDPLAGAVGLAWSDLFTSVQFVATSDTYAFDSFMFTPPDADGLGGAVFNASSVTAVPEPSTWAMLAIGLLLMGALARRQSRASRAA